VNAILSVPALLVIGYREAVALLIGGGMALVFGLIFSIGGACALVQEYQFLTDSSTGIAEIVSKERAGPNNFFVDCRLLLGGPGKMVYERKIPVYSGLWQNLRKGQALNVEYLRTDPANMRLPGSIGNLGDSFLHLLIGVFLAVIGTIATLVAGRFLIKDARRKKLDELTSRD